MDRIFFISFQEIIKNQLTEDNMDAHKATKQRCIESDSWLPSCQLSVRLSLVGNVFPVDSCYCCRLVKFMRPCYKFNRISTS